VDVGRKRAHEVSRIIALDLSNDTPFTGVGPFQKLRRTSCVSRVARATSSPLKAANSVCLTYIGRPREGARANTPRHPKQLSRWREVMVHREFDGSWVVWKKIPINRLAGMQRQKPFEQFSRGLP
jgi:hypothetical protein